MRVIEIGPRAAQRVAGNGWQRLVAEYKVAKGIAALPYVVGQDDPQETPPEPGNEVEWLHGLVTKGKALLKQAAELVKSGPKEQGRELGQALKKMLSDAREAAKKYANDLVPEIDDMLAKARLIAGFVFGLNAVLLGVAVYFWLKGNKRD